MVVNTTNGQAVAHPNINTDESGSYNGSSALLNTAAIGSVETVDLLLQDGRVNPHCADYYGRTALWWATFKGHIEVVRRLLGRFQMDTRLSSYCDPLSVAQEREPFKDFQTHPSSTLL